MLEGARDIRALAAFDEICRRIPSSDRSTRPVVWVWRHHTRSASGFFLIT
jgi:hypothetical protein